jgi:hypothetical protein
MSLRVCLGTPWDLIWHLLQRTRASAYGARQIGRWVGGVGDWQVDWWGGWVGG